MFGKIRASSSSSLESLEIEGPPSKILKDDSLSIYEATLVKLKQGSRRNLGPSSKQIGDIDAGSVLTSTFIDSMQLDMSSSSASTSQDCPEFTSSVTKEVMSIDTDCHLPETHPSSSKTLLRSSPTEQDEKTVSILYLFSKFSNAHHHAVSVTSEDSASTMEDSYSVNTSPSFSSWQSLDSSEKQLEQESLTS